MQPSDCIFLFTYNRCNIINTKIRRSIHSPPVSVIGGGEFKMNTFHFSKPHEINPFPLIKQF